jgi:hypothetical protein
MITDAVADADTEADTDATYRHKDNYENSDTQVSNAPKEV